MKRIVISLLALTVLMACNNKKEEKNLASQKHNRFAHRRC